MRHATTHDSTNPALARVGLKTAVLILEKWGAANEQGSAILGIDLDTYVRVAEQDVVGDICLEEEQLTRISMILNLHATLRVVFDNPHNCYGFMGMANHNGFFNGRSPLEVMAQGDFRSLDETYRRILAMPGSW
ncbi:hypothetical protein [Halomonas sp. M4R1S46]|uniref:hypothetical protein n=1 Tax=Halomonas sp. M4R1S46 TaxID=2982692 RepID=UPI0021E4BF4A|nr:hypothetical protein [Halomonas sp. M4R1S46]UYG06846.1 hypothetical protein OCT48_14615 [Halomonas sp. M4R1S46]